MFLNILLQSQGFMEPESKSLIANIGKSLKELDKQLKIGDKRNDWQQEDAQRNLLEI